MPEQKSPLESTEVARHIAVKLAAAGRDYAIGGAIALGYWSNPRGTIDVDDELACQRRKEIQLGEKEIFIWDEKLASD